jgi:hypothetical protein
MLAETLRVNQANYFGRSDPQYYERQHRVASINRAMAGAFGSARLEQPAGEDVCIFWVRYSAVAALADTIHTV